MMRQQEDHCLFSEKRKRNKLGSSPHGTSVRWIHASLHRAVETRNRGRGLCQLIIRALVCGADGGSQRLVDGESGEDTQSISAHISSLSTQESIRRLSTAWNGRVNVEVQGVRVNFKTTSVGRSQCFAVSCFQSISSQRLGEFPFLSDHLSFEHYLRSKDQEPSHMPKPVFSNINAVGVIRCICTLAFFSP